MRPDIGSGASPKTEKMSGNSLSRKSELLHHDLLPIAGPHARKGFGGPGRGVALPACSQGGVAPTRTGGGAAEEVRKRKGRAGHARGGGEPRMADDGCECRVARTIAAAAQPTATLLPPPPPTARSPPRRCLREEFVSASRRAPQKSLRRQQISLRTPHALPRSQLQVVAA